MLVAKLIEQQHSQAFVLTKGLCFPGISELSWLFLPWICLWQKLTPQCSNALLGQLNEFLSEN